MAGQGCDCQAEGVSRVGVGFVASGSENSKLRAAVIRRRINQELSALTTTHGG